MGFLWRWDGEKLVPVAILRKIEMDAVFVFEFTLSETPLTS